LFSTVLVAQEAPAGSAKKRSSTVTAQDVRELRQTLAAQQQQIQQMQEEMRRRDQLLEQMQQALAQAQSAASTAQEKATAAESAASQQGESVSRIQGDLADVKLNQTNAAVQTQEEQKRVAKMEGILGRFRFTGDVRVRQEDFSSQDNDNCPPGACRFRARERIRIRFGFEGKLNEDFQAGIFLASGFVFDPTSTNETLTNVFERKTVTFDRGYITYNPQAHKWLSLTGGKFAYTWIRTPFTFDSDLNPEGFSEKFSFNIQNNVVKNVTFTAMQLLYNEVTGNVTTSGNDSSAIGGQVSARLQLGSRVTWTPAFSMLGWVQNDVILNEPASVTGSSGVTAFGPNGVTNCTVGTSPTRRYCSDFLYADFINTINVKTPWEKLPLNILLEYEQNLDAATSVVTGTKQDKSYGIDLSMGQTKKKNDIQFGYAFLRQEQDAVLASFNESDQRAPTNVVQHKIYFNWKVKDNVTISVTDWIGRTLNTALENARRAPGIAPGQQEPYLNRAQFDIIYSF
jgi:multidrug efflux pump subunit AcrA (membrane-fusion protein)